MVTITVHSDLEKIREERIKARRLGIKSDPFLVATYGVNGRDRIVLNCPEELASYLGDRFKVMRGYSVERGE